MKLRFYLLTFFLILFLLAGCTPTRHLKGNEKLLYRVHLRGLKHNDKNKIKVLYRQKPNRKIPLIGGTPYLSIYYFGKLFYNPEKTDRKIENVEEKYARRIERAGSDSTAILKLLAKREKRFTRLNRKKTEGNWLMRTIGEPPAIYDTALTRETVSQINTYLSSKGYFHNKVSYTTEEDHKKIHLTFHIEEKKPYRITELSYQVPDPALGELVDQDKDNRLLKIGQNYDEEIIGQERDRLEDFIRNKGYYNFKKQYILFDVDSTKGGDAVQIALLITNPTDSTNHVAYKLRNVYFIEDAALNRFGLKRDTVLYKQTQFLAYRQWVSPRVLARKIRLAPGQTFNQQRTSRTTRQLNDLDVYRYATINYEIVRDSLAPLLDAYIKVNAADRYQASTELGFNFSTYVSSNRVSPLPFLSERLKVRNVFGGAEIMELGIRGGFEGQPSTTQDKIVTTTELGASIAFYFPQFLLSKFIEPFYNKETINLYNPRTRIIASYNFTNRPDYTRANTEISLDYLWQRTPRLQWIVSPIDINIINVIAISDSFQVQLDRYERQGFPLKQSFNTGVITSINAARIYNSNNITQTLDAKYLKLYAEIGDVPHVLSGGALNWFPDWVHDKNNHYKAYSFAKVSADYRRYFKLDKLGNKTFFVTRFNTGIASPIPNTPNAILPYDKFFFAGGGSSVRAWRPRKLGPGTYVPPILTKNGEPVTFNGNPVRNYGFEQPGEILIESNFELRFNVIGFLNMAAFVDAGNIWTVDKDPAHPGSQFTTSFPSELAVGTGIGFRFDFSFLIIRIDMATKVFDPAEPKGHRYVLNRFHLNGNTFNSQNTQNSFNLGIGYPF